MAFKHFVLCFLIEIMLFSCSYIVSSEHDGLSYFIIIDAGSSGSRIHIHQYKINESISVPHILPSQTLKVKPGLSSFAFSPDKSADSLRPLFDFAKTHIPQNQWSKTPLHLQATAGLRSIQRHRANAILERVRDEMAKQPFLFRREWAKIITGQQEGLNGWISLNYLRGVFDPSSSVAPVGLIETGGFSVQVTFVPESTTVMDPDYVTQINLGSRSFKVYSYSYLDFGLEAAQKLFQRNLIDVIEKQGNPCYPKGYSHSALGDYDKCASLMGTLFDKTVKCNITCSFNGVYQPPLTTEQFFANENFFYTTKFFGIPVASAVPRSSSSSLSELNPFESLRLAGRTFCSSAWEDIQRLYTNEPVADLSKYCFSSAYLVALLEAFGFKAPHNNVHIVQRVKDEPIDWALGAVFQEIVLLHSSIPISITLAAPFTSQPIVPPSSTQFPLGQQPNDKTDSRRALFFLPTDEPETNSSDSRRFVIIAIIVSIAIIVYYFIIPKRWKQLSFFRTRKGSAPDPIPSV
eukprot:TRINITY_DN1355_c0_g1_i1.p1 TRINITY_DN1355_c0_g1~~TRINITY_DN1355_c0_g1_i1.p1  ORF type:complete len:519 (-),score=103.77 TRINITY_DN1355_c0_g1_i1:189-1745(-)